MITIHSDIDRIEAAAWRALEVSETANWFQTREAYAFYSAVPGEMRPFCFAAEEDGRLVGVMQGYLTQAGNRLKQWFTRRAIIVGGPMLSDTISDAALEQLLLTARRQLSSQAIYIETRNFNDYSRWRPVFERCGFAYQPHLNFHVDTSSAEQMEALISKSRKRDIKTSLRDGATLVEQPTLEQVHAFYAILLQLYRTKVKTPLPSWRFFEMLYQQPHAQFLLVAFEGQIIGGTACVCLPGKAVYEWYVCGKDGRYEHIFPSSLATYSGMRYAADNGYPRFDMMGAGKPNETYGVRDFKARFGGKKVEHGRFLHVCKPLLYAIGVCGVKLLKL